jgi:hypothetical protein
LRPERADFRGSISHPLLKEENFLNEWVQGGVSLPTPRKEEGS